MIAIIYHVHQLKSYKYWLVRRGRIMAEVRRRRPDLDRDDKLAVLAFAEHVKAERRRQRHITARAEAAQQPLEVIAPSAGCGFFPNGRPAGTVADGRAPRLRGA